MLESIQFETLAPVPRRRRPPGLQSPGGGDMLSRGAMRARSVASPDHTSLETNWAEQHSSSSRWTAFLLRCVLSKGFSAHQVTNIRISCSLWLLTSRQCLVQIPYSITPAQYIQYKDGLKKVRMQAGGGIEARHEAGSGCHRCPVSERK